MKIRADFVTNSSSESSMVITIDNLVLLEILQRYKDMGVFGEAETPFEIGLITEEQKTLAIQGSTWDDEDFQPKKLEEVLDYLIRFISNDGYTDYGIDTSKYDQDLFVLMKKELLQRKEEIDSAYTIVDWWNERSAFGSEVYPDDTYFSLRYHFDLRYGEKYENEYWEPDAEEGENDEDEEKEAD